MHPNTTLPPDLAISARSRKFYDGTYTWDAEGFTDDKGVYRDFDENDPTARAPTPLPPFLGHPEDEDKEDSGTDQPPGEGTRRSMHTRALRAARRASSNQHSSTKSTTHSSSESSDTFTFSSQGGKVTVHRDELFRDHSDRERLLSKLEGLHIDYQHTNTELTLEKCFQLCGLDDTIAAEMMSKRDANQAELSKDGACAKHERNDDETMRTPSKVPKVEATADSPDSDLSTCRSDISDAGLEKPVKGKKTAQKMAVGVDNHKKDDDGDWQPKQKATTRGVAQKVRKGTKGARAGKPATVAPNLVAMQTNSPADAAVRGEDMLGRRRSTRLQKQGGK